MTFKSHMTFGLSQLYFISVLFYTTYGLFKSGTEYFCFQRRSGNPDFTSNFDTGLFEVSNHAHELTNKFIVGVDGSIRVYNLGSNPVKIRKSPISQYPWFSDYSDSGEEYKISYKKKSGFFDLKCQISKEKKTKLKLEEGGIAFFENITAKYIDKDGYHGYNTYRLSLNIGYGGYAIHSLECEMVKSPETCQLKTETTDDFFKGYILIIMIATLVIFLITLPFKRYLFRRMFMTIYGSFETPKLAPFCNPKTGAAIKLIKGDEFYSLKSTEINDDLYEPVTIDRYEDLEGSYYFTDQDLLVIDSKTHKGVYQCSKVKRQLIGGYFLKTTLNPKMCAIDETNSHYIKTCDVLKHVCSGKAIGLETMETENYILDIKEFEFNLLKSLYDIKNDVLKRLLEHNWRFFSNKYNIQALKNCLEKKTWSRQAPSNVGNTQWKYYTSDFKHLMSSLGFNSYKCQKDYKQTDSLKETILIPMEDLTVLKMKGFITLEKEKEPQEFKGKMRVKALNAIISARPYFNKQPKHFIEDELKSWDQDYSQKAIDCFKSLDKVVTNDEDLSTVGIKTVENALKKLHDLNREKIGKLNTYKEVLLNPSMGLSKPAMNRITKLNNFIKKLGDKDEKKIKVHEDEKTKLLNSEKVPNVAHEKLILGMKARQHLEEILVPAVKIITYGKIEKLLEDYEKEIEEKRILQAQSHAEEDHKNKKVVLEKSKIYKSLMESGMFHKKPVKENRRRRRKGKQNKVTKNKVNKVVKKMLESPDFEINFDVALSKVEGVSVSSESKVYNSKSLRPRTVNNLKFGIDKYLKQDFSGKEVVSQDNAKEDEIMEIVKSEFIQNILKLDREEPQLMEKLKEMTGLHEIIGLYNKKFVFLID